MKIVLTKQFIKDLKQIQRSSKVSIRNRIDTRLKEATALLSNGSTLPASFADHELNDSRRYKDCRDCHILGDLVLIYKIEDNNCILLLLRLDKHSNLFEGELSC